MYFRAFQEEATLNLSPETIGRVEYLTTQILVNADPMYLREVLQQGSLIEALYRELSSLGHLQKAVLRDVREYLEKHGASLTEVTTQLMKEPENKTLRQLLLDPLTPHPA
jgi:hypothetical protein